MVQSLRTDQGLVPGTCISLLIVASNSSSMVSDASGHQRQLPTHGQTDRQMDRRMDRQTEENKNKSLQSSKKE